MNPESFLILKTFIDNFITGVYYRSSSSVLRLDIKYLKTYPGHEKKFLYHLSGQSILY